MALCHELPFLPLDRAIPKHVLERRGAISFSSSSSLFRSLPRLERRGGISFDKTEQAAIYVRMLGDVRFKSTKPAINKPCGERRRSSIPENEMKIIEALESNVRRTSLKHSRALSLPRIIQRPIPKAKFYERPEPRPLLDSRYNGQITQLLNRLNHWDFNIFHLHQVTGAHSLRNVIMHLFHQYDLIRHFNLDPLSVHRTAVLIETGYHSNNPYHNALHAADVTQAMHCYLQEKQIQSILTPSEVMGAILASATHDLDHPGVNQVYLIATKNHLAKLYRKTSVLENHHWRAAVSVFKETKIFDHFDSQTWDAVVEQISSLILATDIARQQEFLSRLRKHLDSSDLDMKDPKHRHFIIQIALKCADICNPCRTWEVTKRWAEMVVEEFFNQGDQEKKQNLTVTNSCDRFKTTVGKIQTGFITYVVEPLFLEWVRFLPTGLSRKMLFNVKKNKAQWEVVIEEEKKALEQQKDGATTAQSADSRKGSSGSSTPQGSQVELQIDEAKLDKTSNNNTVAVAKIIVDGRPPTTITATKVEQTSSVHEVKPKLETVKESDIKPQEKSLVDVKAGSGDGDTDGGSAVAESDPKSAMASPSVPSENKSEIVTTPSEESLPQVTRTERTQVSLSQQQQPTRTNLTSSTTTLQPTTEIRSPVIARLSDKRFRSTSLDNVGGRRNVPNVRDRSSTATSSREVGSQATQLGVLTPPAQRAHIGLAPFSLRLYRRSHVTQSPQHVESFGDPWVAREKTSSLSSSTDQQCAIHSGSGSHRTHPLSDEDVNTCCDGSSGMVLTGGLNNNVDVHAAKRLEKQKSQSTSKVSSSMERFERITGIRHDAQVTRSAPSYSSSTHYRELTHSRTEPSHLRTGPGRVLSPDIPRRRELLGSGDIGGRSHSERGSPWIRRKMEERRQKDAQRKEAAKRPSSSPST
ncbi:uncharacterized protein [Amphiura filiformis]|uniref:uncharacterized protein n=1 Tax=Amphiura filiformis TaxID=82378 RepID=UPI003B211CDB